MSVIIDIVIVAVLLILMIIGIKRGLLLMLLPFLGIVFAVFMGFALRAPVRALLNKTPWESNIASAISGAVEKNVDDAEPDGQETGITEEEKDAAVKKTTIPQYIANAIKKISGTEGSDSEDKAKVSAAFGAKAASFIMDAIAVLMTTVVILIIIFIVKLILKGTRKLNIPVLHQVDTVGGAIFGVLLGVAIFYGLAMLVSIIASSGHLTNFANAVKKSFFGGLLYNFNLFGAIASWFHS